MMDLIIDTNIVAAAIVKPGITRNLLFNSNLHLYSPEYLCEELAEHKDEFMEKSGLDIRTYSKTVELLLSASIQVSKAEYSMLEIAARKAALDPDDWPFIALALKMNCAIWSNDKRLKKQSACAVYDTAELLRLL